MVKIETIQKLHMILLRIEQRNHRVAFKFARKMAAAQINIDIPHNSNHIGKERNGGSQK